MIPRAGTAAAHLGCGRCDDGGVEHRDAAAEELNGGVLSPAPASVLVQASSGRGHGAPADLVSAPRAVTRNSRRRLVRVACGGLEDGNGMGSEGKERRERKTAVMIAWVLERKGGLLLLVWSGTLGCACVPRGEENSVAFSPPFLMAAAAAAEEKGGREEGRPGQPVTVCWRARGVSCSCAADRCHAPPAAPAAFTCEEQMMSNGAPGVFFFPGAALKLHGMEELL